MVLIEKTKKGSMAYREGDRYLVISSRTGGVVATTVTKPEAEALARRYKKKYE